MNDAAVRERSAGHFSHTSQCAATGPGCGFALLAASRRRRPPELIRASAFAALTILVSVTDVFTASYGQDIVMATPIATFVPAAVVLVLATSGAREEARPPLG